MICPFCKTQIHDKAEKCPHCTQSLTMVKHPTVSFILLGLGLISFSIWTLWFPPLAIALFAIGAFFIIMGISSLLIKPINKLVENTDGGKKTLFDIDTPTQWKIVKIFFAVCVGVTFLCFVFLK